MSNRNYLEEAVSPTVTERVWTANTQLVFPVTLQVFAVGGVLPAVFYMFRRGHRRGRGKFVETYRPMELSRSKPTAGSVAHRLARDGDRFEGFDDDLKQEVLGDLVLSQLLETKKREESQRAEIIRAYPVHFFSSWLDLPDTVAHLRFVPEFIVALLADQEEGDSVGASEEGDFPVARSPEHNALLRVFSKGVRFGTNPENLAGDAFDEESALGVDELAMVRLAQKCREMPEKLRPTAGSTYEIPNLQPLSRRAASIFRNDLGTFLRGFGDAMPRRALVPMLEALVSLGLWHSFFASIRCAVEWERNRAVPAEEYQEAPYVFVDGSGGAQPDLRLASEQSVDVLLALVDEAAVALACIRVLEAKANSDRILSDEMRGTIGSAGRLDVLGRLRAGDANRADVHLQILGDWAENLRHRLSAERACPAAESVLSNELSRTDPTRALGEALVAMMGDKLLRSNYLNFVDSVGMAADAHGMLRKRKISRRLTDGRRRQTEARSVCLSNELLEALVHRHIADQKFPLSYADFLGLLRSQYGLLVDEAPPGQSIPQELLLLNRATLERRLRDLGLLAGVNDAESMKHLRLRYRPRSTSQL